MPRRLRGLPSKCPGDSSDKVRKKKERRRQGEGEEETLGGEAPGADS